MKTIFLQKNRSANRKSRGYLRNRLLPIMMFLLLGAVQINAQTEKVYTFDNASGWTSKGNIVVTSPGTSSSSTMTCLSSSAATYPSIGGNTVYYSFELQNADSVITKVEYIYRAGTATMPIFFGKAAPSVASNIATFSGTASGGFTTGTITPVNTTAGNCPGESLEFTSADGIKYVGFARIAGTMPAHAKEVLYDDFSIRLNSASGSYSVTQGVGSTLYLGQIKITVAPLPRPTFTVSETPITGLDYVKENGPSAVQSFTFTGSNLEVGTITISAPENFEISLTGADASDFEDSKEISVSAESLEQIVYVRLKAGLDINTYSSNIEISGAGVTTAVTVACSGMVSEFTSIDSPSDFQIISSVKYYTLTGIEVNANAQGLLIVKTFYNDGSVKITKMVK